MNAVNMWIYQHRDWPNFVWDADSLTARLADVRYRQGRLQGGMEALGFSLRREANLRGLTSEVVKSLAIAGENLDVAEVRSAIAHRLGIDSGSMIPVNRRMEGFVEIILDATRGFAEPLSKDRLHAWHRSMFYPVQDKLRGNGVGAWRGADSGPMQVESKPASRETIHFQAPDANEIEREMQTFLFWFEHGKKIDPVLKAGIAQLWFLTIRPLEDGNGRIGRVIANMALARAEGLAERCYSLSAQIETELEDYYAQLEKQQRGTLDITGWLQWFLDCLGRAIDSAEASLTQSLQKAPTVGAHQCASGERAPTPRHQPNAGRRFRRAHEHLEIRQFRELFQGHRPA